MHRKFFLKSLSVLATSAAAIVVLAALKSSPITVNAQASGTQGSLQVLDPNGKPRGLCPLKHTDVKAEISGFLAREGMTARLGRLRWTVAVDEPCSLPLDVEARSASYQLLRAVPGLRLVPLTEAAMCCGGPGTYFHDQPDRSDAVLARKFENVVATKADVLVTENISCLLQLRAGARLYAPRLRVMHLAEVLLASIEAARRREAVVRQD